MIRKKDLLKKIIELEKVVNDRTNKFIQYKERMELLIKWNGFDYKKKLKNTKLKAEFEKENKIVLERLKEFEIEKITFVDLQDLEISFKRQIYKQELINKYKEK